MGDRALVAFHDDYTLSPGIYLHWNGSDVALLLERTKRRMAGRDGDASYTAARFAGIAHALIPGNLSLGLQSMAQGLSDPIEPDAIIRSVESPGDAGVFLIDCTVWRVRCRGGYGFRHGLTSHCRRSEPRGFTVTYV